MRLRRGYQPPQGTNVQEADPKSEEADEAAAAQPVGKLLLAVHGIGQNLGGANIACEGSHAWSHSCVPALKIRSFNSLNQVKSIPVADKAQEQSKQADYARHGE